MLSACTMRDGVVGACLELPECQRSCSIISLILMMEYVPFQAEVFPVGFLFQNQPPSCNSFSCMGDRRHQNPFLPKNQTSALSSARFLNFFYGVLLNLILWHRGNLSGPVIVNRMQPTSLSNSATINPPKSEMKKINSWKQMQLPSGEFYLNSIKSQKFSLTDAFRGTVPISPNFLDLLPVDCLLKIVEFLPIHVRLKGMSTCKQLREILSAEQFWIYIGMPPLIPGTFLFHAQICFVSLRLIFDYCFRPFAYFWPDF